MPQIKKKKNAEFCQEELSKGSVELGPTPPRAGYLGPSVEWGRRSQGE